jgi:hypothetical protein
VSPRRGRRACTTVLGACLIALCAKRPGMSRAYAQHWWEPLPTPTASPTSSTPEPTRTPEGGCGIRVLEAEPVEPFDVVGIVEVAPRMGSTTPESALATAKGQGCLLGGDALVVLYRDVRYRGKPHTENQQPGVLSEPALSAAVIRYRAR